jgi:hypothetical protein
MNDQQEDKILNYKNAIDRIALDLRMTQGQHLAFRLFLNKFIYQGKDEFLHGFLIQKAVEFSRTLEFRTDLLDTNKREHDGNA